MIRVASFDIDDTLYNFYSASCRALDFVLRRMRDALGAAAVGVGREELIEDLFAEATVMSNPCACLPELRRRSFLRTMRRRGCPDADLAAELNRIYLAHRFEDLVPFDGAHESLAELSAAYTVCAVSNGEQDLAQLGLDAFFDFVVLASDIGIDKPDPRIFEAAMERANCAPCEFVHIGDSEHSDVAGAKEAGAYAIWFNPSGRPRRPSAAPDAEVRTLIELGAAIRNLDGNVR